jgi:hypothetical protein
MMANAEQEQGFVISLSENEQGLILNAEFSIFVPCGSQLAFWSDFPRAIEFELKLAGGDVLKSIEGLSSVSFDQSTIEYYRELPCDQVVKKEFSEQLKSFFWEVPDDLEGAEVYGEYLGLSSNRLVIAK